MSDIKTTTFEIFFTIATGITLLSLLGLLELAS